MMRTPLHRMRLVWLIAPVLLLGLLLIPQLASAGTVGGRSKKAAVQVAQATRGGAEAAHQKYQQIQTRLKRLDSERKSLRARYDSELSQLDSLKRGQRGWRQKEAIRSQKAKAQKTGQLLHNKSVAMRAELVRLRSAREQLVKALRSEFSVASESRRAELRKLLPKKKKATLRKIRIPELGLDEFADPEELMEQIALIERATQKLKAEENRLERSKQRYALLARLDQARTRAGEMEMLETDSVRRGARPQSSGLADSSNEPENSPTPGGEGAPPQDESDSLDGGGRGGDSPNLSDSSVVLADIVDSSTQTALRRAEISGSPKVKVAVVSQAQKQVKTSLEKLAKSKARILRHLERMKRKSKK